MKVLDNIVIADTSSERAEWAAEILGRYSSKVDVITEGQLVEIQLDFQRIINEVLAKGSKTMVVFNCVAGNKGGVIKTLRDAEETHQNVTRKILLSCISGREIKKGFKQRGASLDGIRHVLYGLDERINADNLAKLFYR